MYVDRWLITKASIYKNVKLSDICIHYPSVLEEIPVIYLFTYYRDIVYIVKYYPSVLVEIPVIYLFTCYRDIVYTVTIIVTFILVTSSPNGLMSLYQTK